MIELLAPAGNMDSLTAALRCGADAVYTGGKNFSARQNADNLDFSEMKQAIDLCHLYGAKLYIAVNTILLDNQLDLFISEIKKYASLNPDAFIVQDFGAAYIIKNIAPDIRIHASTQMTVHTVSGAEFARSAGFSQVVLARETSAEVIKEISALDIDTEIFVHGALCMSVSGQCYMSAMIGSRSANRGLCAQSCRLPFSPLALPDEHCLSLKDLSLTDHISKIKQTGVKSLKIEGRMKRPEYVAAAVNAYRNALDGLPPDTEMLRSVFSRNGFTDGYFTGKHKNMFGMRSKEDVLSSAAVIPEIKNLYRKTRKISELDFDISIKKDQPVTVTACDSNGYHTVISGDIPEIAQNRATDNNTIIKQFSKLGDTIYSPGNIHLALDDGLCIPASALNNLRREAVENLCELRKQRAAVKINTDFSISEEFRKNHSTSPRLRIRAESTEFLKNKISRKADMFIFPMKLLLSAPNLYDTDREKIIIEPPRFISDEKTIISELKLLYSHGFRHLMCNNSAYIVSGKNLGFILHGDFGLNISNSVSADTASDYGLADITLSFELKLSQIKNIHSAAKTGFISYGKLPLMLTVNCPVKNSTGCGKCRHSITDRTGRSFRVNCSYGYTEIYNPDTIYLADKADKLNCADFMTLYFTDENEKTINKIITDYTDGSASPPSNITRGLYFRGIN